jgi:hypothetical protein
MGLANHARSGQGGGNISKSDKARGIEKGKPFPGAATPIGSDESSDSEASETPMESSSDSETTTKKSMAEHARSGNVIAKQFETVKQPSVASNIPGSGPQGVPPADADEMGAFARQGNANAIPKVVAAQVGEGTVGPAVASSLARMGGQVGLSPGQIGVWAHPKEGVPAPSSTQANNPAPAPRVY